MSVGGRVMDWIRKFGSDFRIFWKGKKIIKYEVIFWWVEVFCIYLLGWEIFYCEVIIYGFNDLEVWLCDLD